MPDRQHELALHAQFRLDLFQVCGVLLEERAALLAEAAEVVGVKILGRRARELRLTFDLLAGQQEIGQRSIGLDALKGAIEGGTRNAHALGLGP